jgi:phosphatidylglycerol:prolipoprotein diacylglycerol transferase
MYPYLLPEVFGYTIPLYDVMIGIGVVAMLVYVAKRFEARDGLTRDQGNRLLVLIVVSLLFALFSSWLFDGLFHSLAEGEPAFGTITFLGGLIGGVVFFLVLLKFFYQGEKDVKTMLNTILTGVVLAHAFGRIGCFFAGCCFGVPTESFLGVIFPHGHAHDLYPDESVFPTQLFESAFLFALFVTLDKLPSLKTIETETYLIAYGVWRILIEFIRGDERGVLFPLFETQYNVFPTPSQVMSLFMVGLGIYLLLHHRSSNHSTV